MSDAAAPCPFCTPDAARVIFRDALVTALWDLYPVNPGHALIVPNRHVAGWEDARADERAALMAAVDRVRDEIRTRFRAGILNAYAFLFLDEPSHKIEDRSRHDHNSRRNEQSVQKSL